MIVIFVAARGWLDGSSPLPRPANAAGDGKPIGRGVVVGHVEGAAANYLPNRQDPRLAGVRIFDRSGKSAPNGHATAVGTVIYGRDGVAPGIRDVNSYTTDDFLQAGCLRTGTDQPPIVNHDIRVFNHSWIGGEPPLARQILRRVDYLIDRHDVVMCVGINNGRETKIPTLLGCAYNVIAVGEQSGNSSGGYTQFDGEGRCKPDLVAQGTLTSFTTPRVTGYVARLLEAIDAMEAAQRERAARSETIKALLMAAAAKPSGWMQVTDKPLDQHFGAGMADGDKSLSILLAGLQPPPLVRNRYGWDYRAIDAGDTSAQSYRITLREPIAEASIMLVWNRRIDGRSIEDPITRTRLWIDSPSLANFDLRLYRTDEQGHDHLLAESTSRIDNVEHVYMKNLDPGRYRIDVRRDDGLSEAWDYALAWRMEQPTAVVEAPPAQPTP